MKRVKMHWRIIKGRPDKMLEFELNGATNCLIPEDNDSVVRAKYLEILWSSAETNFKCTIVDGGKNNE